MEQNDLASITFLTEMIDDPRVIDISIWDHERGYTVQLYLIDLSSVQGEGKHLAGAISNAYDKFEQKKNEHRGELH